MKTLLMARKILLELWREPQLFWVYMLFPALMILMYYAAFGQPATAMSNLLKVQILDRDGGRAAAEFIQAVRGLEYEGSPVFSVEQVPSREVAGPFLAEHKIAMLVVIQPGFSAALGTGAEILLVGDPLSDAFVFARSFLSQVTGEYSGTAPVLEYEFVPGTGGLSDFQFGVPGLIVFGVVFGILGAALVLVRETSSGTLQRMRLAQVRSIDILGGLALALAALTTVQLFLSYALAALFHFQTGGALFLALGICLVLSLGCSGLGMATAGLTHSEGDATNLATGLLVPMVFLSGAIFPMPAAPLFSLAGQTISAYDLMPSTHAAEAMRRVLVYGDGPAQIAYSLAGLALTSSLYLALGAWLYQKRRIHS